MNAIKYLLLLFILTCMIPEMLHADAVRLDSGQVIEGQILEESPSTIIIKTNKGVLTIYRKNIQEIEKGQQGRVVRPSVTDKSPLVLALMSFIPFYSGMYQLDQQTWGVPFATVNGYSFMVFLNHRTRNVATNGYHSIAPDKLDSYLAMTASLMTGANYDINSGGLVGAYFYYDLNLKMVSYALFPEYKEAQPGLFGKPVTLKRSDQLKDESLKAYLISSFLNATISYLTASGQNPFTGLLESEDGSKTYEPVFFVSTPQKGTYQMGWNLAF